MNRRSYYIRQFSIKPFKTSMKLCTEQIIINKRIPEFPFRIVFHHEGFKLV
jgi:hypothetical protein